MYWAPMLLLKFALFLEMVFPDNISDKHIKNERKALNAVVLALISVFNTFLGTFLT